MNKPLAKMSLAELEARLQEMEIEYSDNVAQEEFTPEAQAYAHRKLTAMEYVVAYARKYNKGGNT